MSGRDVPDAKISELIDSGHLEAVGDHWSDAEVFRLLGASCGDAYLKVAPVDGWYPLRDEAARLDWMDRRVPGPAWWKFETDGTREHLLAAALPGRSLPRWGDAVAPSTQVELQAAALRSVHDTLPVDGCPFTLSNGWQVQLSHRLHDTAKIDADYLADMTGGWSVAQAFSFLTTNARPDHLDDVVVHGDPYAGNLILDLRETGTWSLVDWGWCGIGDRWHDLANVYVYLERKLSHSWAEAFLSEYGIERDDEALMFFRVLDALR